MTVPHDPRESATARYALLPLRLFLGLTFLYAGLDKYLDAGPFSAFSREHTITLLEFSRDSGPVPWLVDLALDHPALVGHGTAVAEILVGLAVLAGLATRPAAALGALLTLLMWLTVSWSTSPYYFGADLPYLFGFVTLLLTGSGPYALDDLRARDRRRRGSLMFG
ncbi:DoxX family protein [Streptomyces sp. NPDC059853]|uniref:DoxX family protein n=1 Tax=Streptomyces sp. NPDC059853 TaxID=3346973 RepID=UPI00365CD236